MTITRYDIKTIIEINRLMFILLRVLSQVHLAQNDKKLEMKADSEEKLC
jgi:hypothetical protein